MSRPTVGQRVNLVTLLRRGVFPGEVVKVYENFPGRICVVKLDYQDEPVDGVKYYDQQPTGELPAAYWQVCWPEEVGG